jgi:hypothetical protein
LSSHRARQVAVAGRVQCPASRSYLGKKLGEAQVGCRGAANSLVGLDVMLAIDVDVLEDATLERCQAFGDEGKMASPVTMAEPVDRSVSDDRDESRRHLGAVARLLGISAEATEIIFAQRLAH